MTTIRSETSRGSRRPRRRRGITGSGCMAATAVAIPTRRRSLLHDLETRRRLTGLRRVFSMGRAYHPKKSQHAAIPLHPSASFLNTKGDDPARRSKEISMRIAGFLLLTLVCGVPLMAAPSLKQAGDEALVNASFPRELVDERRLRFSAHERADLDGSGTKNYLVVVYGNGIRGRVRVLRENGDSMEVADETNFRFMRGFLPALRLAD